MENRREYQPQFVLMSNQGKQPYLINAGEQRKGAKKKDKVNNPSLDSYNIAHLEDTSDPNSMRETYVPFCLESNEVKPKKVFKETTNFLTPMQNYQIELLATDDVNTLTGENSTLITKFKQNCEWTLNKSLVAFCMQKVDTDTKYKKPSVFCMDILSFLHIFNDPEMLKSRINDISEKLSKSWNDYNSPEDRAHLRSSNEIPILLDKRVVEKGKSKGNFVELAMTGTMYHYTQAVQNEKCDVKALPQNVVWKLMYQTADKEPLAGQATFPKDDWLDIIFHPQFRQFYDSIWNKFPLKQEYAEEIEMYFKTKTGLTQIVFNDEKSDMVVSQSNDIEEETSSKRRRGDIIKS